MANIYTIKENIYGNRSSSGRALARSSNGDLHCVYSGTSGKVYYAKSSDNGENWTETDIDEGTTSNTHMSIAIDSNDYIHIIWSGSNGSYDRIYYKKYTTSWQSVVELSSGLPLNKSFIGCSMAIDSNDYIHVVFNGFNSGKSPALFYKKYTTSWQSVVEIDYGKGGGTYTSIAIDSNDHIHVIWNGAYRGYYKIFYYKYTTSWSSYTDLSVNNTTNTEPCIAIDSNDYLHVSWMVYSNNQYEIYYKKYTTSWQTSEKLTTSTSGYSQSHPSISIDSDDYIYIIWSGQTNDYPNRYGKLRIIVYTTSWSEITDLISETYSQMYPNLIWANYPIVNSSKTNVVSSGYIFTWSSADSDTLSDANLKIYNNEIQEIAFIPRTTWF